MSSKTLGEARVRTEFNPSDNTLVNIIKNKSAELINLCEANKIAGSSLSAITHEENRLWSLAQTAYEEAAMWAVKAATI